MFNLLDAAAEETLDYWLSSLKSRVRQCPVLICGTHLDDRSLTADAVDLRLANIKRRFGSKYGANFSSSSAPRWPPSRLTAPDSVFAVSCAPKNEQNVVTLRAAVETVVSAQRHMGAVIPRSYLLMEDYLKEQADPRLSAAAPR